MSKDLWDLSERATKYIKENIKDDINEDEVTGLLYQEFCEPTKTEVKALDGLQIGQRVVVQNMRTKYFNGKEGYIVEVDTDYPIITVNLHIEDDIFEKHCFKREHLRSVK